jgi:hypothetical protein
MKLYEENFFSKELEIHWLSIMNSCVLVLLLTGFLVIIIMRILKSDYNRYARAEDEEEDQEDYGWKLIHGDVFRFPPFKNLFTSFLGIGSQCIAMLFSLLILAIFGMFYPNNPGTMYTAGIILYALTSGKLMQDKLSMIIKTNHSTLILVMNMHSVQLMRQLLL